jgi:hypothetical protein
MWKYVGCIIKAVTSEKSECTHFGRWPSSLFRENMQYSLATFAGCTAVDIDVLKVQCTLVQALRLCTGRTARRGSRGIALPFHDHGTRKVWGLSVMPRPLFTPGKDPVPIVQEAGWATWPIWRSADKRVPARSRSPDRPARSQSLYRLRYAHWYRCVAIHKNVYCYVFKEVYC